MLIIKVIQRHNLKWCGDPTDWIPMYVQRTAQTLVLPYRVSLSCIPQAYDSGALYGHQVLVHTKCAGAYPMTELDFVKAHDDHWLGTQYAELMAQSILVKVLRPMLDIAAGFRLQSQDIEEVYHA